MMSYDDDNNNNARGAWKQGITTILIITLLSSIVTRLFLPALLLN